MTHILKKTAVLASLFLFFAFVTQAATITLKPGSKLIYDVKAGGKAYKFIVTFKQIAPDMVFDYEMTAPANKKGTVTIPKAALDSSRELYNYFSGGKINLQNKISVLLSKKVFAELEGDAGVSKFIPNEGDPVTSFQNNIPGNIEYLVNGKTQKLKVERFYDKQDRESLEFHYYFTVLKNADFPLILSMSLNFSITLKEMSGVDVIAD